jgi:hypothetical protein
MLTAADRDESVAAAPSAGFSPAGYRLALAAVILAGFGLMVIGFWHDIWSNHFRDPDDIMRLQQVRDWIAGQSWFDVTQYRINPPAGLPMHWSRLLDVPIAGAILLFRPLVGQPMAEQIACVTTPFLTYAAIALLIARITRLTLASEGLALLAAVFCAADLGVYSVARPMRIDHHGWQVVCGLAMVAALIGKRSARRVAVAGAGAALWMHISLEGIVFTAACGALLGLRWSLDPDREGATLPVYLGSVALTSLALFITVHGATLFDRTYCDAVSPIHMALFAVAAIGATLACRRPTAPLAMRLGMLGTTCLAAGAIYRLWTPQCSAGPFAILTPLGYNMWYLHVSEGQPLWHQSASTAAGWLIFPLVGLAGTAVALRSADRRSLMLDYAVLFGAATLIGVFVLRAGALSNILAIPAALALLRCASAHIQRWRFMPARALVQAVAVLLLLPVTPATAAFELLSRDPSEKPSPQADQCMDRPEISHLRALPPGLVMAQLDAGPAIISASPHSVVGAGYHRGAQGIDDVLRFFATDQQQARAVVERRRPAYVYFCPGADAAKSVAKLAPHGMAAALLTGRLPGWLHPVRVPGLRYGRVYAVDSGAARRTGL